jgi:hypothetical protein
VCVRAARYTLRVCIYEIMRALYIDCVGVYVCVRERERKVCRILILCVCVWGRERERENRALCTDFVCVCVCVCVCAWEREREQSAVYWFCMWELGAIDRVCVCARTGRCVLMCVCVCVCVWTGFCILILCMRTGNCHFAATVLCLCRVAIYFKQRISQLFGDGVFSLKHLSPHHCTAQSRIFENSSKITREMICMHVAMSWQLKGWTFNLLLCTFVLIHQHTFYTIVKSWYHFKT